MESQGLADVLSVRLTMMLQREKIFLYLYLHLSLYLLLSISNTHTYILVRLVSLDALNSPTKPSIHRYNVASTNETREYELWHPSVHKSKQIQHKGMANVKKLALFHHDPAATDLQMSEFLKHTQKFLSLSQQKIKETRAGIAGMPMPRAHPQKVLIAYDGLKIEIQ